MTQLLYLNWQAGCLAEIEAANIPMDNSGGSGGIRLSSNQWV